MAHKCWIFPRHTTEIGAQTMAYIEFLFLTQFQGSWKLWWTCACRYLTNNKSSVIISKNHVAVYLRGFIHGVIALGIADADKQLEEWCYHWRYISNVMSNIWVFISYHYRATPCVISNDNVSKISGNVKFGIALKAVTSDTLIFHQSLRFRCNQSW